MAVTVSSGIGSKLCDRPPVCDCGGRGHLGAIASGRGIERAVQRHAREDLLGFRASQLGSMEIEAEQIRNEEHVVPAGHTRSSRPVKLPSDAGLSFRVDEGVSSRAP